MPEFDIQITGDDPDRARRLLEDANISTLGPGHVGRTGGDPADRRTLPQVVAHVTAPNAESAQAIVGDVLPDEYEIVAVRA